ncbi:MAG: type I-B CRISPR-associated protein Cas5b [Spirochaetia bacterium]|nr:type I-B CRISPR-associated protein Cas5b [Spirochaetota bacterium]MDW8113253.1 type I-B CRISPR-associated protein Cas5b [Spirochaetia bacterium]
MDKVVIFDIYGDFGHFRKFYTTASPLTYASPPPTTVRGIISAILGFDKNNYIQKANNLDVAVKILNPVRKIRLGLNYVSTKASPLTINFKGIKERTQVFAEFLKEPRYRIFVKPRNEEGRDILETLNSLLAEGKTNYTVSLGLAYLLANVKYVGKGEVENIVTSKRVDTVFSSDIIENIDVKGDKKIVKERMLLYMDDDRIPGEYVDVIAEITGKSIDGSFKNVCIVSYGAEKDNVFFFNS